MKKYLPFIIVVLILALCASYSISHAGEKKALSPSVGGKFDLGQSDRAWKDLWLSGGSSMNYVDLNITDTSTCTEGRIKWNSADKTQDICTENSDVTIQVGQEMHVRGTNKTGVTLTNGQVVFINGAQGQRPTFGLANATAEDSSSKTIGIITADITDNLTGYVTTTGLVRDIDTSAMVVGNSVWLSDTPGEYTDEMPVTPNHAVFVGTVLNSHATEGIIYVVVQNGQELYELHDVYNSTQNAIANNLLVSNGVGWSNTADIVVNSITYEPVYWDDQQVDLGAVGFGVSAPTNVAYKGGEVLAFSGGPADANEITFNAQLPHKYKEGTDIDLHAHWTLEDGTSCNAVFSFTHSWANINGTWPGETTVGGTVASSGVVDKQILSEIATMDGTGKTISSVLIMSLARDATDGADTCDNLDVYMVQLDMHYQVDTPGSKSETAK